MMTSVPVQMDCLRLHVDDHGQLWYGDDQVMYQSWCCSFDDLVKQSAHVLGADWPQIGSIRVLGVPRMAALSSLLYQRKRDGGYLHRHQRIQWCSPCCLSETQRHDPVRVLCYLRQDDAVCRAWRHDITYVDYLTCKLCLEADYRPWLRIHPAWSVSAFLDGCDLNSFVRVVTTIFNPRWYRHEYRPNRWSRLYALFGLHRDNVAAYLYQAPTRDRRGQQRTRLLLDTWMGGVADWRAALARPPQRPGSFLWRIASENGMDDPVRGVLIASRRLLHLLARVWLDSGKAVHPEARFNPYRFFRRADEAQVFGALLNESNQCT